ncbi:hypothetical protein ACFGVR_18355 [Mucilaginibacter sp. AW1-3]
MKTNKTTSSLFPAMIIAFAISIGYVNANAASINYNLPADTSKMAKDKMKMDKMKKGKMDKMKMKKDSTSKMSSKM